MEIRIGVTDNPREITIELDESSDRAAVKASIESALSGDSSVLWFSDVKGREVAVASSRVAFVEVGPSASHPIGFG